MLSRAEATREPDAFVDGPVAVVVEPIAELGRRRDAALPACVADALIHDAVAVVVFAVAELHYRQDLADAGAERAAFTARHSADAVSDAKRGGWPAVTGALEPLAAHAPRVQLVDRAVAVVVEPITALLDRGRAALPAAVGQPLVAVAIAVFVEPVARDLLKPDGQDLAQAWAPASLAAHGEAFDAGAHTRAALGPS